MPSLADCIVKAGKALSAADKTAIEARVEGGMGEMEAVQAHLADLVKRRDAVVTQAQEQGAEVARDEPQAGFATVAAGMEGVAAHITSVKRGKRKTNGITRISPEEDARIAKSARETGVDADEIRAYAVKQKAAHPMSEGWTEWVYNQTVVKEGKNGKRKVNHYPVSTPYTFSHDANGVLLKRGKPEYAARVSSIARKIADEITVIRQRAEAGDRSAAVILRQAKWYKEMRTRLRKEFGGLGDLFADFLGAVSPNTPVRDNWGGAVEALRLATRGDFDALIEQWVEHFDNIDAMEADLREWLAERKASGQTIAAAKKTDAYKQKIVDLRAAKEFPDALLPKKSNGSNFGFNGRNVARAMTDIWRVVHNANTNLSRGGTKPKALNFSGNLIGFRKRATIDVWAARLLQRLVWGNRIPSAAEESVKGDMKEDGSTTNQFGFGQDVFSEAVALIRSEHADNDVLSVINDDDLQAVAWFLEKELWTLDGATNSAGEGGSFEFEADLTGHPDQARIKELRKVIDSTKTPAREKEAAVEELHKFRREVSRFYGGLSLEQSIETQGVDFKPTDGDMAETSERIRLKIYEGDPGASVVGSKVFSTEGRYGEPERAFDIEVVARADYDAGALMGGMVEIAADNRQDSTFLSAVVPAGTEIDPLRHRPGVEIYFREGAKIEQMQPMLDQIAAAGAEFYTVVVDGRRTAAAMSGEMPKAVGLRIQYIPEFSARYGDLDPATMSDADIVKMVNKAVLGDEDTGEIGMERLLENLQGVEDVNFAGLMWYETDVRFSVDYARGETNGDRSRTAGAGNQADRGAQWTGQLVREGLEAAVRQRSAAEKGTQFEASDRWSEERRADPEILRQPTAPDGFVTRGYFNRRTGQITLTPNADLSTVLHELGHAFYEMLRDLAPSSKDIQQDIEIVDRWARENGATSIKDVHEMFASGYETYWKEGKSPDARLNSMFSRFRSWLTLVYRYVLKTDPFSANNMPGVQLSDEVRGVFDRLIASEQAVEAASRDQGLTMLPIDGMGLPEAEVQTLAAAWEDARAEAGDEVMAAAMNDIRRTRQAWWKKELAKKEAEVAKEMDASRNYISRDFLSGDRVPEGMQPVKLNSGAIRETYGIDVLRRLGRMVSKDGVEPSAIAAGLGYRTGDELVTGVLNAGNKTQRKALARAEAERRMVAEHGDMMTGGGIEEEARRAVHGDKQARAISLELKILNDKLGRGFAVRGTPAQERAAYKAAAESYIAKKPFSQVKPAAYLTQETKFGSIAFAAATKGELLQAREARQQQLRALYLYRAARNAADKAISHRNRLTQMKKAKYSARQVAPDYLTSLKVLLAAFDLRKNPTEVQARLGEVRAFIDAQIEAGATDLTAGAHLDQITSWKDMTLEELEGLRAAAENLLHIGKAQSGSARAEYQKNAEALEAEAKANTGTPRIKPSNRSRVSSIATGMTQFFSASHRKLESFLQQLDGWKDTGPWQEKIFRPLWDATIAEIERGRSEHQALEDLFSGFEYVFSGIADERKALAQYPFLSGVAAGLDLYHIPYQRGANTLALTRGERVVLALNWGNEGNREAIRNQFQTPFADADVMAAISSLTPEELALVNRIHEYVDGFYPELAAAEREATGVAPRKVEASPYTVNGVQMRGGYYPLMSDSASSWKSETHSLEERANKTRYGGSARASSKVGATIERKGFAGKQVDLDITGLFRHVDGVVHDITHRKVIGEIDGLLRHEDVRTAGINAIGQENWRAIVDTVTRLAAGATHPSDLPILGKISRFSRVATSYGAMGYSVRTAILNVTGFIPAIPEIGPVRMVSSILREFVAPREMGKFIVDKSILMKSRGETINRDVWDILRNMKGNGTWSAVKANAFWMIARVDAFVSRAVWISAYEMAIEDGATDVDAIYSADRTVSRTQGSGLKIDLSRVEDANEIIRMLSPMYTYFNAVLNLTHRRLGKARTGQISKARFLSDMFWIFVVTSMVEEAMFGFADEDEDTETMMKRYLRQPAVYFLGQWFGIRELSSFIEFGQFFETPLQRTTGAPIVLLGEAYDLAFDEEEEFNKGSIRAGTDMLPLLGVPTGAQVNRMAGYLMELEEEGGDFSPWGFLVTGRQEQ